MPAKCFREASRSLPNLPGNSARNKDLFCLNYANDPTRCRRLPGTSLFSPSPPQLPSQEWSSLTGLSAGESATTSLDQPDPRHKADFVLCAKEVILACWCMGKGREDMTIHLISHTVVLHMRPKLSSPPRVAFASLIHFNKLFCSNGNIFVFFCDGYILC